MNDLWFVFFNTSTKIKEMWIEYQNNHLFVWRKEGEEVY